MHHNRCQSGTKSATLSKAVRRPKGKGSSCRIVQWSETFEAVAEATNHFYWRLRLPMSALQSPLQWRLL
ncbi:unnamed protein product, partial [Nesidiocoris tenuis]